MVDLFRPGRWCRARWLAGLASSSISLTHLIDVKGNGDSATLKCLHASVCSTRTSAWPSQPGAQNGSRQTQNEMTNAVLMTSRIVPVRCRKPRTQTP